ncbi:hypothetical protein DTO282F9_2762 [Paecilomyces variotii]|nr:hypothetical protein DTO282F9_2762 [Paecilomyces variotii]
MRNLMPKYLFPYRFPFSRYHLIQSRSYSVPISAADRNYNAPVSSAEQTAEIVPPKDFAYQRKPDERPISPEEKTEEIIPSSKPPEQKEDGRTRYAGDIGLREVSPLAMLLLAGGAACGVSGYFYLSAFERSQDRELGRIMAVIHKQDELQRVNIEKHEREIGELRERVARMEK